MVSLNSIIWFIGFAVALRYLYAFGNFLYRSFLRPPVNLKKYGSWAAVTGCTDGIGEAYAKELARKGLNIFLISRTQEKLNTVAKEIEDKYKVKTKTLAIDFATATDATYKQIQAELEKVEVGILVNNVGVSYEHCEWLEAVPNDIIDKCIKINIESTTYMTKYMIPSMASRKRGAIINLSSISGVMPAPLLSVYGASKAYVDHFSRMMSFECASKGIFIQSLTPAFVVSKMSGFRRPTLTIPQAAVFARSAVKTIGYETSVAGFWAHDVIRWGASFVPESLVGGRILAMHIALRAKFLARAKKQ